MSASPDTAPGGFALVEAAVDRARRSPIPVLAAHIIGTAPFVAGVIAFWATMASSGTAAQVLPAASLGVAALYLWMVLWQSRAMHLQLAWISDESPPHWGLAEAFRTLCRQGLIQATALLLYPIATLVLVPLPWLHAFYHHAAALDDGRRRPLRSLVAEAATHATRWPRQNLVLTWLLSPLIYVVIGMVWLNLMPVISMVDDVFLASMLIVYVAMVSLVMLPLAPFAIVALLNVVNACLLFFILLYAFIGVQTPFVMALEAAANQTYFAAMLGLAYLMLDPVCRTAYVLRTHHAQSRVSGADLQVALRRLRALPKILVLTLAALAAVPVFAQDADVPATATPTVDAQALDAALHAELARPEYVWRMPRIKEDVPENWFRSLVQTAAEWIRTSFEAIRQVVSDFFDWLTRRSFGLDGFDGDFSSLGMVLRVVLMVLCAALLGVLVYLVARYLRDWKPTQSAALSPIDAPPPDLRDEATTADALPDEGWLQLAEQLLAQGEHRLAARALFLAVLAALARREWIAIARAKSNLDYRRELRRRGPGAPELIAGFDQCSRDFESVWYGTHPVSEETIARLRRQHAEVAARA